MSQKSPAQRIAEYKEKAVAAKMAGDLQTAADWYCKAARLADFDSASEYARIAFPHIYDPIPNPKKVAADGTKIYKWESDKYSKLNMKLFHEPSEEVKFQKRQEALQKIAAKYDHPMVDQLFGTFYEAYCGIKGESETYYKKAAERGDFVAARCLVLAYGRNSYRVKDGIVSGVEDMEQFWKYVFLTYELSKQRLAWFTHRGLGGSKYSSSSRWDYIPQYQLRLLNKMAEYMCSSVAVDLFPQKPPAEGESADVTSCDDRPSYYKYANHTEEDKESLFLWLRALCDAFPALDNFDVRHRFLCFMYAEGYGCEKDMEKARQVFKNVPMADGSTRDALVKYIAYSPKYEEDWVNPIVAYLLAEEWVKNGENLEQAKDWLTCVSAEPIWEKYRIAAQELLDKLG